MKKEEIIENNKLIAEFMEFPINTIETLGKREIYGYYTINVPTKYTMYGKEYAHIDKLRFHESWDWLMPVVEKCFSFKDNDKMSELTNKFDFYNINEMYNAVITYIKWYNEENGK